VPADGRRRLWLFDVDRPAIVLGSGQRVDTDLSAGAVEVVRRRSGGGAVLLEPGGAVWVDVVVPRGDALWDDDVGRAAHWLGEAWAEALAIGDDAAVHRGALQRTRWSSQVCFAGLGPGEVTASGRKVVGISARRTRDWARFQTVALAAWDPGPLVELLGLPVDDVAELAGAAAGVPLDGLADRVVAAITAR
jgi:lipoate---protein ligase